MKKSIKRVLAVWMMFVLVISGSVLTYAGEKKDTKESYEISIWDAEDVAVNHIISIMRMEKESNWNNGVRIKARKALFDFNNELSAFYFGLVDSEGKPAGYVITSAVTTGYPIIEYAQEGESFIDKAIEVTREAVVNEKDTTVKSDGSKVYYLGGVTYAIEHTLEDDSKTIYDISTGEYEKADKKDFAEAEDVGASDESQQLWAYYKEINKNNGCNNPPDSEGEGFITNPNNYESGYVDSSYYTVMNGYRYYNIMTDFSNGGVCSPTAATNLCEYWYLRDPSAYGDLYKNCSWTDVFWRFYNYMDTDMDDGTSDYNVADAYMLYFEEVGLSCSSYYYSGTNSGRDIVDELNHNRPCHLMVHGHYKYHDHSVLAVGY